MSTPTISVDNAVLLRRQGSFPCVHDLAELTHQILKCGLTIPANIMAAVELTPYAVEARYPGFDDPVAPTEHRDAMAKAARVLEWAETHVPH